MMNHKFYRILAAAAVMALGLAGNLFAVQAASADSADDWGLQMLRRMDKMERQMDSAYYERSMLSSKKLVPELVSQDVRGSILDTYVLEFLDLPEQYSEKNLRKAIMENLKQFILEFGKDFSQNCNNKLSIQSVRSLLIEEDPAQSRREPQASDETGPERGVKQQISGPFLPRMLHPEYGTPGSFVEDRWPTAPRPGSYLHRNCRLSFPLAGIGGSGRCGSQWYLFHRKYTDA